MGCSLFSLALEVNLGKGERELGGEREHECALCLIRRHVQ